MKKLAFIKTNKDTYLINYKNGITVSISIPERNEDTPLIEQIQGLFCNYTSWLKVSATYVIGKQIIDITEQLTGMAGDRAVASAEELTDFLYNAKHYTPKQY